MATNLAIDDNLLILAQNIAGLKTKKDTVNQALKEFVQRRKQEEIVSLFGEVSYEDDYDYKAMRSRK
ncbi:MAG: type II toxin-antitoxin system VapB family antitoxin [Spirochaetia bacterium]|nr:type II toxin-antitoxin system VapB family antitoxin [Spirochaetia bacterium]